MMSATKQAIQATATADAAKLCAAQMETLAKGTRTFVKGKPVIVPSSDARRASLKALALSAFTDASMRRDHVVAGVVRQHIAAEGVVDADGEDRLIAEATAAYEAAGVVEVERLYAA